ncbi:MAG: bifunctional UDP-3-O-[3-hydroxymyristoyl] N-acetylglucosamine deacetylase/3-hydroxyacyl-ACP dehydratase [Saprospiraceae bacterium]|nr:bifunctional UDP-3-O-[3-hydroxymyristoyl] N-acetylglucosamine deacetylase/3-hydroxyacyl-ACP dehydratase [Saprospiraceae bacterium]
MKQKTIAQSFRLEGIGLHTGELVKVECKPAEEGKGIVFKRIDLENHPEIPASIVNVDSTYRSTTIKKGEIFVHTIEHLLSAFRGFNIDNVIVELSGPEVPILDGSAQAFVKEIQNAGVKELEANQEIIQFSNTLNFKDPKSGSEYTYLPIGENEESEITSIIEYSSKVGVQVAMYNQNVDYATEIAPSRTFVFVNEIEELFNQGVIKGGSVDNAIVFSHEDYSAEKIKAIAHKFNVEEDVIVDNGILNGLTLQYPNEPARHKLLDLLGDLYLLRKPIRGKIIAKRPGHTGNVAFAKFLKDEFQKVKKLRGKPVYDPTVEPLHTLEDIKKFIPHRYPFLLVDKIISLSKEEVVGIKNVTGNEGFFVGHFPGNPVFPGVLQMEALAQTGGILALSQVEDSENWDTYFLKMDNVKFKKIVRPGDTIILKMQLLSPIRRGIVHMQGIAYVGDAIVSEGELTAQIIKRT